MDGHGPISKHSIFDSMVLQSPILGQAFDKFRDTIFIIISPNTVNLPNARGREELFTTPPPSETDH